MHRGGVTWLDLDGVEHRWLLSAAADASVAAYDIQARGLTAMLTVQGLVLRPEILLSPTVLYYMIGGSTGGAYAAQRCMQEGRQERNAGLGERLEGRTEHVAAFKLDRSNAESHKYTVTSVCWYPIDTGMFVTGSFDQEIKVGSFALALHVSRGVILMTS